MGFDHLRWVWPEGRLAAFGRSDDIGSRAGALVCRRENASSLAGQVVACSFIYKFDFRLTYGMDHFAADMFNYKNRVTI